jgi:hypothetical protein
MLLSTSDLSLAFQQTGDTYGGTKLTLLNRNGANGARFEQLNTAGIDLVDFMFATQKPSQFNLRYEARTASVLNTANSAEFQFANMTSGSVWFAAFGPNVASLPAAVGIGKVNPAAALDVVGDVALTGSVDGRDVAADGTKLDSVYAGAYGLRNATTIVLTSTASAPVAGQVLKATSTTAATWQAPTVAVQEDGVAVANTPHGTLNFGPGITATDAGSGVANIIGLANNFQFLEAAADMTGNNATQNKVSMSYTCLAAGNYRIGYKMCLRSTTTTVRTATVTITVDGTTYTSTVLATAANATGKNTYTGVDYVTLAAGARTINLTFNSANTCIASNAWIEVWRAS